MSYLCLIELSSILVFAGICAADCTLISTGKTPLNDLSRGFYLGQQGGLYPEGTNTMPAEHFGAGQNIALNEIRPLNAAGNYDPLNGKIVLISVGMSNTTQEFATRGAGAFKPRANADPAKNPKLLIVDCAQGGHAAKEWLDLTSDTWTVAQQRLSNAGVTAAQVQVAWVKLAERSSDIPADKRTFPANAQWHQGRLEEIYRMLHNTFPNLRLAFLSGRTRAYTDVPTSLNPEPLAYEQNFSVKWAINQQIDGTGNLNFDPLHGPVAAPFMAWGPYLWIDGETHRSDGQVWLCSDVYTDFTHPSEDGVRKVADQLLAMFKTDPLASPWFLRQTLTGSSPTAAIQADVVSGPSPLTVNLSADAADPDGAIVDYAWSFGDGCYNLGPTQTKTFFQPGTHTVRLTVTDNDGNTKRVTRDIIVYSPPLLLDDYLAYWPCSEDSGQTLFDSSENRFNGQIAGCNWTDGVRGTGLVFDPGDSVEITDDQGYPDKIGALHTGTISLWFKFDYVPGTNTIMPLFYVGDGIGGSGNSSLIIEIGHFQGGSKLYFTILDDDAHIPLCFDSNFNLTANTWYHFAVVVSDNSNTGYLNGQEMTNRHYNFGGPNVRAFISDVVDRRVCWLGRGFLGSLAAQQYLAGQIDEVRIYDRPLRADEIGAYYNMTLNGAILPGDITANCKVNLADLAALAAGWQMRYGIIDLAVQAQYWLETSWP